MSRKSVRRFCGNDMRKNKDLKREERIWKIATRFRHGGLCGLLARLVKTSWPAVRETAYCRLKFDVQKLECRLRNGSCIIH
ncbi:hypothetical protein GFL18_14325 [Rhizobium leguminosarum bv. viciae]|nr:hypothetical protein [Rhizobium leguminosarum bv. viciae]